MRADDNKSQIFTERRQMELIRKNQIKVLANPGVESAQLLNPENSTSEKVTITKVRVEPGEVQKKHAHEAAEQIWVALKGSGILLLENDQTIDFFEGDVVRFPENTIHGLQNDFDSVFEYLSVTSPPLNFRRAYRVEKQSQ